VTEGRVSVDDAVRGASLLPAAADGTAVPVLVSGERLVLPVADPAEGTAGPALSATAPAIVREVAAADIQRALAWQERRLEFEDLPLAEVVAEFNRYNRTRIVIADPALHARRFSGTFRADGYEPFVRLLEENFGVVVERGPPGIALRAAR
jgi:transmembrane sensor